jgi:hypothetical protein|tara:strand:- start:1532 stop:2041 length:510 start_codon:yes stop_codon:yes gene_type:complete
MSDDLFNLNLTDVEEDSGSIGPMPAGDYEMIAASWESKNSKATNHKMLSVTYEVVGPKYSGRKVWENFMLEGNGLNVSKGKLRNWRKAMGLDPDMEAFGLEDLESMMNVPFNANLRVEEGRDKGDGTKWEDKNVIAKFLAGGSSAVSSPSPAPAPSAASKEEDPFDWDK